MDFDLSTNSIRNYIDGCRKSRSSSSNNNELRRIQDVKSSQVRFDSSSILGNISSPKPQSLLFSVSPTSKNTNNPIFNKKPRTNEDRFSKNSAYELKGVEFQKKKKFRIDQIKKQIIAESIVSK